MQQPPPWRPQVNERVAFITTGEEVTVIEVLPGERYRVYHDLVTAVVRSGEQTVFDRLEDQESTVELGEIRPQNPYRTPGWTPQ